MKEILKNSWKEILIISFLVSTLLACFFCFGYLVNLLDKLIDKYDYQNQATKRKTGYFHADGTPVYIYSDIARMNINVLISLFSLGFLICWIMLAAIFFY